MSGAELFSRPRYLARRLFHCGFTSVMEALSAVEFLPVRKRLHSSGLEDVSLHRLNHEPISPEIVGLVTPLTPLTPVSAPAIRNDNRVTRPLVALIAVKRLTRRSRPSVIYIMANHRNAFVML